MLAAGRLVSVSDGKSYLIGAVVLLQRVAAGDDDGIVTPGARRFQLPAARRQLGEVLQKVGSWMSLGCEPAAGRKIRLLGADVTPICYARAAGKGERLVVTAYYTRDRQAAYFDLEYY